MGTGRNGNFKKHYCRTVIRPDECTTSFSAKLNSMQVAFKWTSFHVVMSCGLTYRLTMYVIWCLGSVSEFRNCSRCPQNEEGFYRV